MHAGQSAPERGDVPGSQLPSLRERRVAATREGRSLLLPSTVGAPNAPPPPADILEQRQRMVAAANPALSQPAGAVAGEESGEDDAQSLASIPSPASSAPPSPQRSATPGRPADTPSLGDASNLSGAAGGEAAGGEAAGSPAERERSSSWSLIETSAGLLDSVSSMLAGYAPWSPGKGRRGATRASAASCSVPTSPAASASPSIVVRSPSPVAGAAFATSPSSDAAPSPPQRPAGSVAAARRFATKTRQPPRDGGGSGASPQEFSLRRVEGSPSDYCEGAASSDEPAAQRQPAAPPPLTLGHDRADSSTASLPAARRSQGVSPTTERLRAYSGASGAHAKILAELQGLQTRPVVSPARLEREHRRELSRVYAARMWQARWRQYVRRKLLNSEDEAIMNAALMSDISGDVAELIQDTTPFTARRRSEGDSSSRPASREASRRRRSEGDGRLRSPLTVEGSPEPGFAPPSYEEGAATPPGRAAAKAAPLDAEAVHVDVGPASPEPEAGGRFPLCRRWCLPRTRPSHHARREPGDIEGKLRDKEMEGSALAHTLSIGHGMHVKAPPSPDMKKARLYASQRLARQHEGDEAPGELYPLYTPLETFDRFGTDVSQYMHFVLYTSRLFFCLFAFNLANLIINLEGQNLAFLELDSAAAGVNPLAVVHTLGNTESTGVLAKGGHSYGVIEFITSGVLVVYIYWLRGKMSQIRTRIRNSTSLATLTAADFTVMVSHLPDGWGSDDVRGFFERFGQVVHVSVSLNNRGLILEMKRTQELRDRHTEAALHLLTKMSRLAKKEEVVRARVRSVRSLERFERHRARLRLLMRGKYQHTGHAFVTFNKASVTPELVRRLGKGGTDEHRVQQALGAKLHVKRAPEPSDVLWENLQYSRRQQRQWQCLSTGIMCVLATVGIFTIFVSNYYLAPGVNPNAAYPLPAGQFLAQMLGALVVNIGGHLIFFILVLFLAKLVEVQYTHREREKEMMIKMTVFQILSVVVPSFLYLFLNTNANELAFNDSMGRFGASWYVSGGQFVIVALVGDATAINLFIDLVRPVPDLFNRYVLARRAKTQAKMDELWTIDADLTLGFRVQLMNKIVFVGLMFAFAIPILYGLIFLFLFSAHWVDRYTLLRRLTPPPVTHDGLMEVVIRYIFPVAVLTHTVMAVIFFNDICVGSKAADEGACERAFAAGFSFDNSTNSSDLLGGTCVPDVGTGDLNDLLDPERIAVKEEWAEHIRNNANFDLYSGSVLSLECLVANASQSGAFCTVVSGCSLELSGAHVILICGAFIWGIGVVVYLLLHWCKRRRDAALGEKRRSALSTFSLNAFRFIMQRDVLRPAEPSSTHLDARIWPTGSRVGASPGSRPASPPPPAHRGIAATPRGAANKRTIPRTPGLVSAAAAGAPPPSSGGGEDNGGGAAYTRPPPSPRGCPPILAAQAPMYLPPLTRALLEMYGNNARLDRRLLKSYLQIANVPIQQGPGGSVEELRRSSLSSERSVLSSLAEPLREASGRVKGTVPSVEQVRTMRDALRQKLGEVEQQLSAIGDRETYQQSNTALRGGLQRGAQRLGSTFLRRKSDPRFSESDISEPELAPPFSPVAEEDPEGLAVDVPGDDPEGLAVDVGRAPTTDEVPGMAASSSRRRSTADQVL